VRAQYDVAGDRQRFVVVQDIGDSGDTIVVVQNWIKEFETK